MSKNHTRTTTTTAVVAGPAHKERAMSEAEQETPTAQAGNAHTVTIPGDVWELVALAAKDEGITPDGWINGVVHTELSRQVSERMALFRHKASQSTEEKINDLALRILASVYGITKPTSEQVLYAAERVADDFAAALCVVGDASYGTLHPTERQNAARNHRQNRFYVLPSNVDA